MKKKAATFLKKRIEGNKQNEISFDYQVGKTEVFIHWHDDCEIIYVIEGRVKCFYHDEWGYVKENTMVFIPPGKIHCLMTDDENAKKIVIGFSEKLINTEDSSKDMAFPMEIKHNDEYCHFDLKERKDISHLFFKLKESQNMEKPLKTLVAKASVLEIYAFIYDFWKSKGIIKEGYDKNPIAERVLALLSKNPIEAPSPYEMAKKLNISYCHLNNILKKEVGTSYTDFVNKSKLEMAKKRIIFTDMSITDIGYECNFCDTSYFIKLFKRQEGISPKEYRKIHK